MDSMPHFNWIDYALLAIIALSLLTGLSRGLVREMIALAALIIALVVATFFAAPLAQFLSDSSNVQHATNHSEVISYVTLGLSFALLFFATIILGAIIGFIIHLVVQSTLLGFGDRLLGGVFGLVRGLLMNLVIIFLVQLTSFADSPTWKQAELVQMFEPIAAALGGVVSPHLEKLTSEYPEILKGNLSQHKEGMQ
ncbi:MAG: hypothetical protein A3F43_02580 [Gammaproteobacteria bacterium RIFCSPHIGHO2_12_FULL_42_10]|nr:MAG: hypothetical protein A3F43_02580 [Gammaproteobacteria bacterium RIFCSPHIGHO2_12_FULL_42_10]